MPPSKLSRFITYLDSNGQPITFTYKGNSAYKSFLGGVISILVKMGVIAFFCVQMQKLAERVNSITFKTTYISNTDESQEYNLTSNEFDIAVTWLFFDG